MEKALPTFTYVSEKYAHKIFKKNTVKCDSCQQTSDYVYTGPIYMPGDTEPTLCPQCIHDGSAAKKYRASFNEIDGRGLETSIRNAVCKKTPGYSSWQDQNWATHCHDACVYHGDASEKDVAEASEQTRAQWMEYYDMQEDDWSHFMKDYRPDGDQGVYKFICRHCNLVIFNWDFS